MSVPSLKHRRQMNEVLQHNGAQDTLMSNDCCLPLFGSDAIDTQTMQAILQATTHAINSIKDSISIWSKYVKYKPANQKEDSWRVLRDQVTLCAVRHYIMMQQQSRLLTPFLLQLFCVSHGHAYKKIQGVSTIAATQLNLRNRVAIHKVQIQNPCCQLCS